MPWGTVWRSAPRPGPLPAAADANLSAEAAGVAERGSGGSGAFAASLKANCALERKAGSRLGRARPSEALPREARRRARCRPTRDRHPRILGPRIPAQGRGRGRAASGAQRPESRNRNVAWSWAASGLLPRGPTRARSPSHVLPRRRGAGSGALLGSGPAGFPALGRATIKHERGAHERPPGAAPVPGRAEAQPG